MTKWVRARRVRLLRTNPGGEAMREPTADNFMLSAQDMREEAAAG